MSKIDYSMLELFVSELEAQTRTFEEGLLALEGKVNTTAFEKLMRAAHSIKGAARIIGLNQIIELSHKIEDIFEYHRKNNQILREDTFNIILECNDFFSSIINQNTYSIPEYLDNSRNLINNLLKQLQNSFDLFINENQGDSKPENNSAFIEEVTSVNQKLSVRTSENKIVDKALIDLFIGEIKSNSSKVIELLKKEQISDESKKLIKKFLNSMKGASKIVGIEEPVFLINQLDFFMDRNCLSSNQQSITEYLQIISDFPSNDNTSIIKYYANLDIDDMLKLLNPVDSDRLKENNKNVDEFTIQNQNVENAVNVNSSDSNINDINRQNNANSVQKEERFVKVISENLNKILGLSGEILVQVKHLKPFSKEMQKIKNGILELNSFKESIYHDLLKEGLPLEINQKFIESSKQLDSILSQIINFIESFEGFARRIESTSDRLYNEAIETRMKPFSDGLHGFPRLVRDLSKELGKKVELKIIGNNTRVDRDILDKLESPINHLIRNAIDHGLENPMDRELSGKNLTGTIILEARHSAGLLLISVSDDGKGINLDTLRNKIVEKGFADEAMASNLTSSELYEFLFLPGFSTRESVNEISGRGVGLDVVFSMINEVGGIIKVDSEFGKGTTFQLQLPLTLSVVRSMLVEIDKQPYALPLSKIDKVLSLNKNDILTIENAHYINYNSENIGIVNSEQIFGINKNKIIQDKVNILLLSDRLNKYGLVVDRLISQPELVVIPLDKKLGRIPNISAAAILEDGTPVLIIDADDVVRSIDRIIKSGKIEKIKTEDNNNTSRKLKVLVVDDSLTVREVERKLLENKGYMVTVAIDGIDGWNTVHKDNFDLIISDIDMPRMNGIEMVKRIKSDSKLRDIPVMIVSYKDREDDRKRGLEAGANYYLTKSSFHDDTLIEAVEDLIGKAL